ncbi:MAG TPA: hypothetical protein PLL69_10440 [Gemmatimonadales bacterium]|nr:hypothetical protein [Gemmatimonadales bacterium]
MPTSRREFLAQAAVFAGALPVFRPDAIRRVASLRRDTATLPPGSLADDEA